MPIKIPLSTSSGQSSADEKANGDACFGSSEDESDDVPNILFLEPRPADEGESSTEKRQTYNGRASPGILEAQQPLPTSGATIDRKLAFWITANILATVSIVFTNKAIFSSPLFRSAQLSFASFHFFVTFAALHLVSHPRIAFFSRRKAHLTGILPLAGAMCLNVILTNLSLAFSSVTFYQTARVMLTPVVAVLNYILYQRTIPKSAAYTLIAVCFGVAVTTYYDAQPRSGGGRQDEQKTTFLGVVFASLGVIASSIYTIWISSFPKKLEMSSVQLLHNQALVGAVLLLYFIPVMDTLPVFWEVSWTLWGLVLWVSTSSQCLDP